MKKQLIFQKTIVYVLLILLVGGFTFSLGLSTTLHDTLKRFAIKKGDASRDQVLGAQLYYDIQPFNRQLVSWALIGILVCLILLLTNTNKRRKYYLSNYIATGIVATHSIALSMFAIFGALDFRNQYLTRVDFASLEQICEQLGRDYYVSTLDFDLCIATFALVTLASLAIMFNSIWKYQLIKKENNLLQSKITMQEGLTQ